MPDKHLYILIGPSLMDVLCLCLQLKIVCGGMDGLRYALCTVLQLLDLYQAEEGISIPTLLVRCKQTNAVPMQLLCFNATCMFKY